VSKQIWTVYLPREQVRAYADKTEPTKYPEKFAEFVEASALAKANAEVERLRESLKHIVNCPDVMCTDCREIIKREALSEVQK
jgi:hypothetical protein